MIEIKDLHVEVDGKEILKGVNLTFEKGKVYALMGPNGSGKSTLANVLMGHPKYVVTKGEFLMNGENLLDLSPDERAKKGVFMSFQYPNEIPGLTTSSFLRAAYNATHESISILKFKKLMFEKMEMLHIKKEFATRYLNEGFSGGEKKRNEILQFAILDPKFAILDETDSGLDIDALKAVAEGVNSIMNSEKIILVITHYKRIFEYIKPCKLSILLDGKIVKEGGPELVDQLEAEGYGWIEE